MSGNDHDEKLEAAKHFPLDLASKLTTIKSVDGKAPLIIPGQSLRGMRLLTQTTPSGLGQGSTAGTTIIATNCNIVPQGAVIKQGDTSRTHITGIINTNNPQSQGNITIQRQAQISLATSLPVVAQNVSSGATYHVPRGPAVVANLSAPRSNVASAIRGPMVVTAQGAQSFTRPARTPSPAQATAWLTSASNGSQIKTTSAVLSSPIRGTTIAGVTGKPQIVTRPQIGQVVSTIRPTAAILHSAIIGQGQLHPFKPGQGAPGIQTLNTTVTLAQVVPNRTQTLVYNTGSATHFAGTPRITVSTSSQRQQTTATRPMAQVTATRLAVPVNVKCEPRLVGPQATVLTTGTRISTVSTSQPPSVIGASTRIISTTQGNVSLGRLTVTVTNPSTITTNNPLLTQIRSTTLAMHPIVASNNSQARTIQTQGAKVITQPTQGTAIHLAQMPATIKSTPNIVATANRTINAQPATIVAQRSGTVVSSHAIPIAKVFPQQGDGHQVVTPTNVYIQAPVQSAAPRRPSPGPTNLTQTTNTVPTTTVATYFYDPSGNYTVGRTFAQQPASFTISQNSNQQRPTAIGTQVHGIVANQSMRFNPIMVVEPSRGPLPQETAQENVQSVQTPTKVTSSPRPSILRKRDHEGSPLKAAKNLIPALSNLQQQQHQQLAPISPPSRPDSRNNGHSSGGSTTISATSSPGLADANEDSMPHVPMNKEEEENRPPIEMSPRKKPRKQNLAGNDMDEHNDDMQFISERDMKKEQDDSDCNNSEGPQDGAPESRRIAPVRKPASACLLNSYRHTWKTTHNHYLRYADVRPKEERRPTIMDLANQHRVLDKVNGWKIHHLTTQMDELADHEDIVHTQLTDLLKITESKEDSNTHVNRINELIKGNLQRIKVINEGMAEAKSLIMKIFDHKVHVSDIINRCASKRNFKKRDKS